VLALFVISPPERFRHHPPEVFICEWSFLCLRWLAVPWPRWRWQGVRDWGEVPFIICGFVGGWHPVLLSLRNCQGMGQYYAAKEGCTVPSCTLHKLAAAAGLLRSSTKLSEINGYITKITPTRTASSQSHRDAPITVVCRVLMTFDRNIVRPFVIVYCNTFNFQPHAQAAASSNKV
jgi:hypothetical protein